MVQAVDLSCKTQHTLLAPAMFGDAILVSDIIPSCRDRLFGYRTDSPCRYVGIIRCPRLLKFQMPLILINYSKT